MPVMLDFLVLLFAAMFCGTMLGLIPDSDKDINKDKNGDNGKEKDRNAIEKKVEVDERTRIRVEMELLQDMLQARREKLERLDSGTRG